jgi:hypothetical protein
MYNKKKGGTMKQKNTSKKVYLVELKTKDKPIRVSADSANEATQKVYKKYTASSKCGLGEFMTNVKSCSRIINAHALQTKEAYEKGLKLYSKYKNLF